MITSSQSLNKKDFFSLSAGIQKTAAYSLILGIFADILLNATDNLRYDLILSEDKQLVDAMISTLWISLTTLVLSMVFGFIFFLALRSKNVFIKTLANALREIVMGTPLLVMIFLVVYVFGIKSGISNKPLLGIVSLTAYMSPYIANAYETASAIIDKDQYTVMDLYNFNLYQRYRYSIIPQMIRPLIPSMLNNLSSIIKGSALLKIISVTEISYIITVISNKSYASIEGYMVF